LKGLSEVSMQRGVTLGHFQHCCTVEKLGNANILQKTFSSACLDHKFTS
jgi:hypothetical protein